MATEQSTVSYYNAIGFYGYRVGDDGSVWSRRQTGRNSKRLSRKWHQLKGYISEDGILYVTLSPGSNKVSVAHLVLRNFYGKCPEMMQACHNDGDPLNNNLYNLRWDTAKNNSKDKSAHGTNRLAGQVNSFVNERVVRAIRDDHESGMSRRGLSEKYNLHKSTIRVIVKKHTWTWVE